jgi:uncharacterized protein (TIGR01244 family)
MSNMKIFAITFCTTTCVALGVIFVKRPAPSPDLRSIGNSVFISSQLKPENVSYLRRRRINAIVDLRPDGEAADEPSHTEMEAAARQNGMRFYYVPVPHESIPPAAVEALAIALRDDTQETVLYCRSGRRAARAFALVQASRQGGPALAEILSLVQNAGFSADDLRDDINRRIASRTALAETKK